MALYPDKYPPRPLTRPPVRFEIDEDGYLFPSESSQPTNFYPTDIGMYRRRLSIRRKRMLQTIGFTLGTLIYLVFSVWEIAR